jgi:uncharacterized cupin superfamily protein
MKPTITRFDAQQPPAETGRPEKVLAGDPRTSSRNFYASADQRFFSGVWESTAGKWPVNYSEHEFVHMLSGVAVLTSEDGDVQRFETGDSFVVPPGFKGTWESIGEVKKLYAIYD